MDLTKTPYFSALRAQLGMLSERQRLIAENIANASTPGYTPRDVDKPAFERALLAQARIATGAAPMTLTHPAHRTHGQGVAGRPPSVIASPDSETTLDGNQVVLEEQTIRAGETRAAYETGLALYQKGLQLYRMAARAPNR